MLMKNVKMTIFCQPTLLLLTANTDSDAHSLVVTVFDDIDDLSWYNHHDYFLAALPCL
jgi:hypothetical protein